MTSPRRRVGRAVLGLAVLSLGYVFTAETRAGRVEKRKVTITNHNPAGTCDHDVDLRRIMIKKNVDDVEWKVTNKCALDQNVMICVYRLDAQGHVGGVGNPFARCNSDPAGADLERAFRLPAVHGKTTLTCRATKDGHYLKQVLVGDEVPPSCPANPLAPAPKGLTGITTTLLFTHQLDIEVQP